MKVEKIISELTKKGAKLRVVDHSLKVNADHGVITPELQKLIREHKGDIINFITASAKSEQIPSTLQKPHYKLSYAQRPIYFLYEFDRSSLAFNLPYAVELKGELDKNQLEKVVNKLISRHESLRTYFELYKEEPVQKIVPELKLSIEYFKAGNGETDSVIESFIRPFNLEQPPLIRVGLIEVDDARHILLVDIHHIISDAVSMHILINDFVLLFKNEALPEFSLQYKDYAEWQQQRFQNEINNQKQFWLNEFSESPNKFELPTDFVRPMVKSQKGDSFAFLLNDDHSQKLRSVAENTGTTLYMVLISVFNILLSKLSNREDITVGTSLAGRQHADLENIIGMFVNTLALRNYPEGKLSFEEFLMNLKNGALTCFDNQSYPYESLVEELEIERVSNRNPLFDVMFVSRNFGEYQFDLPGITIQPYELKQNISKFDFTLYVTEQTKNISLNFVYAADLFKRKTIKRFSSYFIKIVDAIVDHIKIKISDIDILSENERNRLLVEFNTTQFEFPKEKTIIDLFEDQSLKTPGNVAVVSNEGSITYLELSKKVKEWSNFLSANRSNSGIVALYMEPSIDMIIGILSIMRSGQAFLPLDPYQQSDRVQDILEDSECSLLLTQQNLADQLSFSGDKVIFDRKEKQNLKGQNDRRIQATDLCYLIYTSGSTGKPKGVKVQHSNLVNYAIWLNQMLDLSPDDRSILTSSYAFDLGYSSIFPILISGGELHMIPRSLYYSSEDLVPYIEQNSITYLKVTPSLFKTIIASNSFKQGDFSQLNHIILGGESIVIEDVKKAHKMHDHITFINHYGPTETTIGSIAQKIDFDSDETVTSIGRPIHNTRAFVLDQDQKPVPLGVPGELCLAGAGVGQGYFKQDELTNEKFISSPLYPYGKIYRTGDMARWLPNGIISFLGRSDNQVKIRGYRVELDEISHQLYNHEMISDAVVIMREEKESHQLVGYYVAEHEMTGAQLSNFLSYKLPDYMIPSHYIRLDQMPLNQNGKLDVKTLPDPELQSTEDYRMPTTEEELLLAEMWSQVLGIDKIGVTDSFFLLGGDSIKCIQVIGRVRNAGFRLTVQDIFTDQTIDKLALKLKKIETESDQSMVKGTAKLSPIQQLFWERETPDKHHYNQSVLLRFSKGISEQFAKKIFQKIQLHHDVLRSVFITGDHEIKQDIRGAEMPVSLEFFDLKDENDPEAFLSAKLDQIQSGIDLRQGPLMKLGLFQRENESLLAIVIHHLVVDGVSWRILLEDIETLYRQLQDGKQLSLASKTDSILSWSEQLARYVKSEQFEIGRSYWSEQKKRTIPSIPRDNPNRDNRVKNAKTVSFHLNENDTHKLLTHVNVPFKTEVNDILLAALLMSIDRCFNLKAIKIDLEGHGREHITEGADVSRTVGWFTSIYPAVLEKTSNDLTKLVKEVKESLRGIPNKGIDYLICRSEDQDYQKDGNGATIRYNYLGQFDTEFKDKAFSLAERSKGREISPDWHRAYDLDFVAILTEKQLQIDLTFGQKQYKESTINFLMSTYHQRLVELINYCCDYKKIELTPSDLTYNLLPQRELDVIQKLYQVEDVYPLSPMQEGLFFHWLLDPESESYFEQKLLTVKGQLDATLIKKALNELIIRYDVLRTVFAREGMNRPLQIVLKARQLNVSFNDIRPELERKNKSEVIENYKVEDQRKKFDLSHDVLMRLIILQTDADEYEWIWSYHHILMDAWCMGIILKDFQKLYAKAGGNSTIALPQPDRYANYIQWLETRDNAVSKKYWGEYLSTYSKPVTLLEESLSPPEKGFSIPKEHITELDRHRVARLNEIAGKLGVTVNTILQTAWGLLMAKYNNVNDVVFGAVVSGRPSEVKGVEEMVGLFINTIPVRVKLDEKLPIDSVIKEVQQKALQSEKHQYQPLYEIQSLNGLGSELFDNIIAFENYPITSEIDGLNLDDTQEYRFENVRTFEYNSYHLTLYVFPGDSIHLRFVYSPTSYEESRVKELATRFKNIIYQIIENDEISVSEIELITQDERNEINDAITDYRRSNLALEKNIPVSYHQERLWFIDKFETGYLYENSPVYHNLPLVLNLNGDLNRGALEKSIHAIVQKYGILRTGIVSIDERPFQNIHEVSTFNLEFQDVRSQGAAQIENLVLKEVNLPFDLEKPLIRGRLFQTDKSAYKLVLVFHHIMVDRYSVRKLSEEIISIYDDYLSGSYAERFETTLDYTGFLSWQKQFLSKLDTHFLSYWKPQLSEGLKPLELPTDRPRATVHTYTGAYVDVSIPRDLMAKLRAYELKSQISAEILFMGIFNILLNRYSQQEEIVIGTSALNRKHEISQNIIGPVANLIVIRSIVSSNTSFFEYVSHLKEVFDRGLEYQDMPFDKLVKELAPNKDMSRTALFDVLYQYEENVNPDRLTTANLNVSIQETNFGYGKYDLNLLLQSSEEDVQGKLVYNADYFDRSTIELFVKHYYSLIQSLLHQPTYKLSGIELIPDKERPELLAQFDNINVTFPKDKTIVELFKHQVTHTPGNIAVVFKGKTLTYAELDARSTKLAWVLRGKGVSSDQLVGILVDRSIEMVVGILAILKSGGAYLPIDTDYPKERIDFFIEDSGLKVLLTTKDQQLGFSDNVSVLYIEDVDEMEDHVNEIDNVNKPSDLCYVIYTSGTTGVPKGVMVEHKNVVRLFFNDAFQFDFGPKDVWTMFHSHCFDFSVWEIFGALLSGGKLVIIPKMIARDTKVFWNILKEQKVTVLNQTPSAFYNLMEEDTQHPTPELDLRYVIFGGEALSPKKLASWRSKYPETMLINMFGITETTVHVTYKEIGDKEIDNNTSSIGKPIPTLSCHLFDQNQKLIPNGVIGELYVGGEGVSRGYLNNKELTNKRFIPNPYNPSERLYRTGDLARILKSGDIEYLGRIDNQVQLRGFRIELGEIEMQLSGYQDINECVVVAKEKQEHIYLAAYYVSQKEIEVSVLKSFLSDKLPEYMIPSFYIHLMEIPLTSNGKLDKTALPAPEIKTNENYESPLGATEEKMAAIWADILDIEGDKISRYDNFFELGGHSIIAVRLIGRIQQTFAVTIRLKEIFTFPTVEKLSQRLENVESGSATTIPKIERKAFYQTSYAQKRCYFEQEIDKRSTINNTTSVHRIIGKLDHDKLDKTFQALVDRHEGLRTHFEVSGNEVVSNIEVTASIACEYLDGIDYPLLEEALDAFIRPFDLSSCPLLRYGIYQNDKQGDFLLVDIHHIVCDGVSLNILMNDFIRLYSGDTLPPLALDYVDYAVWQQAGIDTLEKQRTYWAEQLLPTYFEPDLPTLQDRGSVKVHAADRSELKISTELSDKIKSYVTEAGVSNFMFFLSCYYILLSKMSGSDDIIISTNSIGRTQKELENIVGSFVNLIPLRADIKPEMVYDDFLSQVKTNVLMALENQDFQYDDMVLMTEGNGSSNILDLFFSYINFFDAQSTTGELSFSPVKLKVNQEVARFGLELIIFEYGDHFQVSLRYSSDLYDRETIELFTQYYYNIVQCVLLDRNMTIENIEFEFTMI